MNKEHVAQLIKDVVGSANLIIDELLKDHTSFKVGGPADIFAIPRGREQLTGIIDICKNNNIPYYVIGNGTNVIVRDKGIRGVVIKISEGFRNYSVEDDIITAEAGLLLSEVSNIALNHELTGLEFAAGIPGTLGGAVAMNAGAYTGEMKDAVIKTQYMDLDGKIKTVRGEEHKFGYRRSFAQETGGIVLMSCLQLKKGSKSDIRELMNEFNRRRKEKQPIHMPSAGSVFKRPEGYFAGKLIEDCDLKGYGIGGAEVSSMHCGFIVNKGNATADDIIRLIKHVQVAVKEKFGVDLEREVRIIGEE